MLPGGKFVSPEAAVASLRKDEEIFGRLYLAHCSGAEDFSERTLAEYNRLIAESGGAEREIGLPIGFERLSGRESRPRIARDYPVRGADIYLFQQFPSGESTDEKLMELLLTTSALRDSGAKRITVVLPYIPYARQDKPSTFEREPISARVLADMIAVSGADRAVSWDVHAEQLRGFFRIPFLMIRPYAKMAEPFAELRENPEWFVAGTDAGDLRRVSKVGKLLRLPYTTASKERDDAGVSCTELIVPSGRDKAILADDIIASGGSYRLACEKLECAGVKEIFGWASHLVGAGSPELRENLAASKDHGLSRLYVTNSVPFEYADDGFLRVVPLEETFARVINRLHYGLSTSEIFRAAP